MSEHLIKENITDHSTEQDNRMVILITGFPGFLTRHLLNRLGNQDKNAKFVFLVLPNFRHVAESQLKELESEIGDFSGRWQVAIGDITLPRLGFDDSLYKDLTQQVTHVWHFAAIYDLSISEQAAIKVNVFGTLNILDF